MPGEKWGDELLHHAMQFSIFKTNRQAFLEMHAYRVNEERCSDDDGGTSVLPEAQRYLALCLSSDAIQPNPTTQAFRKVAEHVGLSPLPAQ